MKKFLYWKRLADIILLLRTGIPTVDVCFDADRLDLGRVGITPNPKLMASEQGAYYAKNIHLLNLVRYNLYED